MERTITTIFGASQPLRKRVAKAQASPSTSYKDIASHATRGIHPFLITQSTRHRMDMEIDSAVMAIAAAGSFEFDMTCHIDEVRNLAKTPSKIDLSPVPPAAFFFPEPIDAQGSCLAMVTRGMIGQVVLFNSKSPSISLLPPVFEYADLEKLLGCQKQANTEFDDDVRKLATAQLNNIAPGAINTPQGQQQLQFMMQQISNISAMAHGGRGDAVLDMETKLHDMKYGELDAPRPGQLEGVITALAAAHVMRQKDKAYGGAKYLNTNAIDRGWTE